MSQELRERFRGVFENRLKAAEAAHQAGKTLEDIVDSAVYYTIQDMIFWAGNHRVRLTNVIPSNVQEGEQPQCEVTIEPVTEKNWQHP